MSIISNPSGSIYQEKIPGSISVLGRWRASDANQVRAGLLEIGSQLSGGLRQDLRFSDVYGGGPYSSVYYDAGTLQIASAVMVSESLRVKPADTGSQAEFQINGQAWGAEWYQLAANGSTYAGVTTQDDKTEMYLQGTRGTTQIYMRSQAGVEHPNVIEVEAAESGTAILSLLTINTGGAVAPGTATLQVQNNGTTQLSLDGGGDLWLTGALTASVVSASTYLGLPYVSGGGGGGDAYLTSSNWTPDGGVFNISGGLLVTASDQTMLLGPTNLTFRQVVSGSYPALEMFNQNGQRNFEINWGCQGDGSSDKADMYITSRNDDVSLELRGLNGDARTWLYASSYGGEVYLQGLGGVAFDVYTSRTLHGGPEIYLAGAPLRITGQPVQVEYELLASGSAHISGALTASTVLAPSVPVPPVTGNFITDPGFASVTPDTSGPPYAAGAWYSHGENCPSPVVETGTLDTTDPDSGNAAIKISFSGSVGAYANRLGQTIQSDLEVGGTYQLSFWLRTLDTDRSFVIAVEDNSGNWGAPTYSSATQVTAQVAGWAPVSFSWQHFAADQSAIVLGYALADDGATPLVTDGTVYVYDMKVEQTVSTLRLTGTMVVDSNLYVSGALTASQISFPAGALTIQGSQVEVTGDVKLAVTNDARIYQDLSGSGVVLHLYTGITPDTGSNVFRGVMDVHLRDSVGGEPWGSSMGGLAAANVDDATTTRIAFTTDPGNSNQDQAACVILTRLPDATGSVQINAPNGSVSISAPVTITGALTASSYSGLPHEIAVYASGTMDASEVLLRYQFARATTWEAGLSSSYASADVASAGTVSCSLQQNGSEVASVTFATSATGTFSASLTSWAAGDVLTVVAPSAADANLAGVSLTLVGTR